MTMSLAAVPEMINYQGVLTDDTGTPIDITVSMTFTIYDAETDGNDLWTETTDLSPPSVDSLMY